MTQIILDKPALIARLEEQRREAVAYDKAALAVHREAEAAYLAKFRDKCREAVKWDYATVKDAASFRGVCIDVDERPSCPAGMTTRIDRAVRQVELSQTSRYTLNPTGVHANLYALVTWTPDPAPADLCG
jgi:hypothetical protein